MIIDFHTHIFPPDVRVRRAEYVRRDPTFAEMYADPKAKIATAADLLASMEQAGVDMSVALGFAWRDHELIVQHNDYLLEAAAKSGSKIVPFATVNMADARAEKEIERVARAGAKGLGELRPDSQGWDLNAEPGDRLTRAASSRGLPLLFHVTEPGGRDYPGKEGLTLGRFFRYRVEHPDAVVVGAHLAGGLPLHAPEAQRDRVFSNLYLDTAAQPFLYPDDVYDSLLERPGPTRLLLGSDFPLVPQERQINIVTAALSDDETRALVLGGNAARLLGLD